MRPTDCSHSGRCQVDRWVDRLHVTRSDEIRPQKEALVSPRLRNPPGTSELLAPPRSYQRVRTPLKMADLDRFLGQPRNEETGKVKVSERKRP